MTMFQQFLEKKRKNFLWPSIFNQTNTHRPSLLKELKDQQPFPIATFQTSISYIQHLIWLKNIYSPQSATSKRLPT